MHAPSPSTEQNWFLTDDERRVVRDTPETGFIPEFIEYVGLTSDTPEYGLRAAALTSLSLAAGDTVVLENFFDETKPTYLNLYVMLVGPSTTMRKSTVVSRMQRPLPVSAQTGESVFTVLDDVSPQSFGKAAARAGQRQSAVLFDVDEIAGIFEVSRSRNGYMAGFERELLKAYDHSPIRITRNTSESIDAPAGAYVCLFGATTPEPLLAVLDSDDVASGLLPRFIIFDLTDTVGGPRRPLAERRSNGPEAAQRLEQLQERLNHICTRATGVPNGIDESGTVTYPKTIISYTDQAVERLDLLEQQTSTTAATAPPGLAAIFGRSFHHMNRLAGLNALSRMADNQTLDDVQVELIDVLRAAWLIETTMSDLVNLQNRLGATHLERQVQDVLDILKAARGNKVKQTTIVNRLKLDIYQARRVLGTVQARGLAEPETSGKVAYWGLSQTVVQDGRYETLTRECLDRGSLSKTEIAALFSRNIDAQEINALIGKAVLSGYFTFDKDTGGRGRPREVLQPKRP